MLTVTDLNNIDIEPLECDVNIAIGSKFKKFGAYCDNLELDDMDISILTHGQIYVRWVRYNHTKQCRNVSRKRFRNLILIDILQSDNTVEFVFECDYSLLVFGSSDIKLYISYINRYFTLRDSSISNILSLNNFIVDNKLTSTNYYYKFYITSTKDKNFWKYRVQLLKDSYFALDIMASNKEQYYICDQLHELIDQLNILEKNDICL